MATAGLVMGYLSAAFIPLVLIIAAIAIPNLLRATISANESAAASTLRAVNTAHVTYATSYPSSGYARSLAVLGPGADCTNPANVNEEHACLIDGILACSQTWCRKGGYKYNTAAVCGSTGVCENYVITATPAVANFTGNQSFCSTSDAIIRVHMRGPVLQPLTVEECQAWPPLS